MAVPTLIEWRQNKQLVARAVKVLETPEFQEMLAVLERESPVYYPLPKAGVTADDRSAQLGRIEGACFIISALKSMGVMLDKNTEPQVTYA